MFSNHKASLQILKKISLKFSVYPSVLCQCEFQGLERGVSALFDDDAICRAFERKSDPTVKSASSLPWCKVQVKCKGRSDTYSTIYFGNWQHTLCLKKKKVIISTTMTDYAQIQFACSHSVLRLKTPFIFVTPPITRYKHCCCKSPLKQMGSLILLKSFQIRDFGI